MFLSFGGSEDLLHSCIMVTLEDIITLAFVQLNPAGHTAGHTQKAAPATTTAGTQSAEATARLAAATAAAPTAPELGNQPMLHVLSMLGCHPAMPALCVALMAQHGHDRKQGGLISDAGCLGPWARTVYAGLFHHSDTSTAYPLVLYARAPCHNTTLTTHTYTHKHAPAPYSTRSFHTYMSLLPG